MKKQIQFRERIEEEGSEVVETWEGLKEESHFSPLMKNQESGEKRNQMLWKLEEQELHVPLLVNHHGRWRREGDG